MIRSVGVIIFIAFLFSNCGKKESGSGGSNADGPFIVSGSSQKGPFAAGSKVTVQPLKNDFTPTGEVILGSTSDDLGNFRVEKEIRSRYVEITVEGYFFDEIKGALSNGQISLHSISDLSEGAIKVNIFTSLQAERLKKLAGKGLSFAESRTQSKAELLQALNLPKDAVAEQFDKLDLTAAGDGNAALLAISSVFAKAAIDNGYATGSINSAAELSSLLSLVSVEFAASGQIATESFRAKLLSANTNLNMPAVRQNLENRYKELGVSVNLPSFEDFVDSDGDGKLNKFDTEKYLGAKFDNFDIVSPDDLKTGVYTSNVVQHASRLYLLSAVKNPAVINCGGTDPQNVPMRVRMYNPESATWNELSGFNLESDGRSFNFVSHKNKLFLFNKTFCYSNILNVYDSDSNSWTEKTFPCLKIPSRVISVGDFIYSVWSEGDCGQDSVFQRYSPESDTWTKLAPLSSISALGKCLNGYGIFATNENIFLFGGYISKPLADEPLCIPKPGNFWLNGVNKTFKYSMSNNSWSEGSELPGFKFFPATSNLAGRVWTIGGFFGESVFSFDLSSEKWSKHPIQFPQKNAVGYGILFGLGVINDKILFRETSGWNFYSFLPPTIN